MEKFKSKDGKKNHSGKNITEKIVRSFVVLLGFLFFVFLRSS